MMRKGENMRYKWWWYWQKVGVVQSAQSFSVHTRGSCNIISNISSGHDKKKINFIIILSFCSEAFGRRLAVYVKFLILIIDLAWGIVRWILIKPLFFTIKELQPAWPNGFGQEMTCHMKKEHYFLWDIAGNPEQARKRHLLNVSHG